MNIKSLARIAVAASIGLASLSAIAAPANSLLGSAVASAGADRTVALNDGVTRVSVDYGETVRFVTAGGQDFAVKFDGIRTSFDLGALAPAGALNRKVTAYVNFVGSYQER